METLNRITEYLNEFLHVPEFSDTSRNGLQVSGKQSVRRIATLVDASRAGFEAAAEAGADMIIVHHGLFWDKPVILTELLYERVKVLISKEISLYAAHLPLDAHPEIGNNIQLLDLIGAELVEWYADWGGKPIGCIGKFNRARPLSHVIELLDRSLNTQTNVLDFGGPEISTVGIVSGSACEALAASAHKGVDLFITGEPRLSAVHEARELELNVAFAGHYATESVGVKALAKRLPSWFDVEAFFIDVPCNV